MTTEPDEREALILEALGMLNKMASAGPFLTPEQCHVLASCLRAAATDLERSKDGRHNGEQLYLS